MIIVPPSRRPPCSINSQMAGAGWRAIARRDWPPYNVIAGPVRKSVLSAGRRVAGFSLSDRLIGADEMAKHGTDPAVEQLARAVNESGPAPVPAMMSLWRISPEPVDTWTADASPAQDADKRRSARLACG